jgi:hypothetical protein
MLKVRGAGIGGGEVGGAAALWKAATPSRAVAWPAGASANPHDLQSTLEFHAASTTLSAL